MSDNLYNTPIGRNYTFFNQFLSIREAPNYFLNKIVTPTFDLTKVTTDQEFQILQQTVASTATSTVISLAPPAGYDHYYLGLSLNLPVARTVDALIVNGNNIVETTASQTIQVLVTRDKGVYVPDGFTLQITVNSSLVADGNITVGISRVQRLKGLGPLAV